MALIDNSECKVMEEESNSESTGVVPNPFSYSIEISRTVILLRVINRSLLFNRVLAE